MRMNLNVIKKTDSEKPFFRYCSKCKEKKGFDDYYWDSSRNTLFSRCKVCLSGINKNKYKNKNK